jgi:hypothetical protein
MGIPPEYNYRCATYGFISEIAGSPGSFLSARLGTGSEDSDIQLPWALEVKLGVVAEEVDVSSCV